MSPSHFFGDLSLKCKVVFSTAVKDTKLQPEKNQKATETLSCGAVCFVLQCGSDCLVCGSNHAVWTFFL